MKQINCFESPCGKANIYVEADMPIGVFHDFLMQIKGQMVDRMVLFHQQQTKEAEENLKDLEQKPACDEQACSSEG